MQLFDVKIPVKASSSLEAGKVQKALLQIGLQFTPEQLTNIAVKLQNPLVKTAILQKLG